MRERIAAFLSRLSAMEKNEVIHVETAKIERWSADRWGVTVKTPRPDRDPLTAHTLNRAALFVSALEAPVRIIELHLDHKALRALPEPQKARVLELPWRRPEAERVSDPLPPDQAQAWREKLEGVDVSERDITADFVIGVTNAPAAYDGFMTTEVATLGDDRLVAMRREHAETWQVPRYASGLKVCEIVADRIHDAPSSRGAAELRAREAHQFVGIDRRVG